MGLLLHDPAQFSDVSEVVHELVKQTGVDSSRLLLVGARCRDLLHHQFGYQDSLRRTDDIDTGLVATSLHDYRQIVSVLPRIGRTGARFAVGAFAVDIMPFGPIEHPDGTAVFGPQLEKLSVESFQAVWGERTNYQSRCWPIDPGPTRSRLCSSQGTRLCGTISAVRTQGRS